jgi:hypothetical protein
MSDGAGFILLILLYYKTEEVLIILGGMHGKQIEMVFNYITSLLFKASDLSITFNQVYTRHVNILSSSAYHS